MKTLIMLIVLFWLPFADRTQDQYLISDNSKITISGTSTLHDWTMETGSVKGAANIEITENKILSIKDIKVEIPVESLKSGDKKMDKNAWEALKSSTCPTIYFQLNGFDKIRLLNGKSAVEVTGNLTIAGKTRPEKILVSYKTDHSGNLSVSGSKGIKMTDYGVTPPEVMFGAIKTGNEIIIQFDLNLAQNHTL